jgi:DNA-binding response OmpR family regulator
VDSSSRRLLAVTNDPTISKCLNGLGDAYRINTTADPFVAIEYLRRAPVDLVIIDLQHVNGSGVDICAAAKALPEPPCVLVAADEPAAVPPLIAAGCDSALLKPVTSGVVVTRLSRLLKERSSRPSGRSRIGTNQVWADKKCPSCGSNGPVSFDYASLKRLWYACLACKRVWTGKRL